MPEYSFHFGGPIGAIPEYDQEDDAAIFRLIFSNGVFSGLLNELEIVENDPVAMAVGIKSGWAFDYGRFYNNTSLLTKTLAAADPDNPRIDRIILRLDTTENFKISGEVLTGIAAADPDPPELTQTATTYEIPLYQVLVGAAVTSVSNANLTDERTYAAISNAPVTLTNAVVLTNKTLTKPVINGTDPTGAIYTPATGAQGVALDCAANNMHIVTGHAQGTAITFTISNATNNQPFIVSILQGAVVSTIAAWFATVRWADGVTPTLTATVGKRDTFGFIRTGANTYDGFIVGQNL